jgi:hypothetical protein
MKLREALFNVLIAASLEEKGESEWKRNLFKVILSQLEQDKSTRAHSINGNP